VTTKVVCFVRGDPAQVRAGWRDAPVRASLGTALDLPGLPPAPFAAVDVLWFAGEPPPLTLGPGSVAVAVEEVVLRGAEALAARRDAGGEGLKMMSFGRRNPALSPAEFADRWRREAGRLGGDPIPDKLRGVAYAQDHPRPGTEPAFDAINEVWFDRIDDLRRRMEWFAARPVPADLWSPSECWSVSLREEPVG
jgi:EthD domain